MFADQIDMLRFLKSEVSLHPLAATEVQYFIRLAHEEVLMNDDGSSTLRGRMNGSSFELGRQEQENPGVIT